MDYIIDIDNKTENKELNNILQRLIILDNAGIKINIQNNLEYFNDLIDDQTYLNKLLVKLIHNQLIYEVNGKYNIDTNNTIIKNIITENTINVRHIESFIKNSFKDIENFVWKFVEDANKLNEEFNLELFEIYYSQELCRQLFSSSSNLLLESPFDKYNIVSMGEHRKKAIMDEDIRRFIQQNNIKSESLPSNNYLTDVTTIFKTNNNHPLFIWTIEVKLTYKNTKSKFLDIIRLVIYLRFFDSVKFSSYLAFDRESISLNPVIAKSIALSNFDNEIESVRDSLPNINVIHFYNDNSSVDEDKKSNGIVYNSYENIISILDKSLYILDSMLEIVIDIKNYTNIFPLKERLINLNEYSKPVYSNLLNEINSKLKKNLIENPGYNGDLQLINNYIDKIKSNIGTPISCFLNNLDPYKIRYIIFYCYIYSNLWPEMDLIKLIIFEYYNIDKTQINENSTEYIEIEKEVSLIKEKIDSDFDEDSKHKLFIAILYEISIYLKEINNNNIDDSEEKRKLNKFRICHKAIPGLIRNFIKIHLLIHTKNIFCHSKENDDILYAESNINENIQTIQKMINSCGFPKKLTILTQNFINDDSHNTLLRYIRKNDIVFFSLGNLLELDFSNFITNDAKMIQTCQYLQIINENFYLLGKHETNSKKTEEICNSLLNVIEFLKKGINDIIEEEFLKELKS